MALTMATEVEADRRRIIRRPRLTTMLDGSLARIRLLIGPAGYGKTTLAREWVTDTKRKGIWYRGGPASADVAALAAGIAEAVGAVIPDAGKRMRERLRATGHPEEDVAILADLFAEDVQAWPPEAWLAIDDYHFAMESLASEQFIGLLTQSTPIQMLITSRTRPTWATARRILYGEILEVDRRCLAMEADEVQELVGKHEPALARFLEGARGWPAVIGLVALGSSNPDLAEAVPEKLYDFFAEELYESIPRADRVGLAEISLASRFDRGLAEEVLGSRMETVVDSGLRSGALNPFDKQSFDFHPLLAEFLQERVFRTNPQKQRAASKVGRVLLSLQRWDDAVDLAWRFKVIDLLTSAMEDALYSLLDSGRLATVTRWLDAATLLRAHSPVLDLAEAEVAFRVGDLRRAEGMAEQAARRLSAESPLMSRAHFRAGHSALLRSKEQLSISHFHRARETARAPRDLREALFGLYSAMSELDRPEATDVLADLDSLELDSPDDRLRAAGVKLTNALRTGDLRNAVDSASLAVSVLEKALNPLIITSFLHVFSNASSATGQYHQGLELARKLLSLGDEHRLGFVRPFGVIDSAIGHLGLRSFADANHDVEHAAALVPDDVHIQGNLAALRCRILLATGRVSSAAHASEHCFLDDKPPASLHSELLAYRALALACDRDTKQALMMLNKADTISKTNLVVQVLAPVVRVICTKSLRERERHARNVWATAVATGHVDTLVSGYRAYPDLLKEIAKVADRDQLASVLVRSNDGELGQRYGIEIVRHHNLTNARLTPRETEVMDLVATGLSNKEVAEALFIVESTVKLHLRHAYKKLDARGRAEAVAKWLVRS